MDSHAYPSWTPPTMQVRVLKSKKLIAFDHWQRVHSAFLRIRGMSQA
jgi:hypothetical protein